MISYCVACYRPVYARLLLDELICKTTVPCEILLWLNVEDATFDLFLQEKIASDANLRIVGRSPQNIGMAAYPALFAASRFDMIVQIDDDVVCIAPKIAENARFIFDRMPQVGMLVADVWQDDHTTGARPPMEQYRLVDAELGLYDGPVDGWFAIYRRRALQLCSSIRPGRYYPLGGAIRNRLRSKRMMALLCTRLKVFHVIGPCYVDWFGMLDSEIQKYRELGRGEIVNWYEAARHTLPPGEETRRRIEGIYAHLEATD